MSLVKCVKPFYSIIFFFQLPNENIFELAAVATRAHVKTLSHAFFQSSLSLERVRRARRFPTVLLL